MTMQKLWNMIRRFLRAVRRMCGYPKRNMPQPTVWNLEATAQYSQSAQPQLVGSTTDVPPDPSGQPVDENYLTLEEFDKEQAYALKKPINTWIRIVRQNVESHLQQYIQTNSAGNPDDIFGAHTAFVKFSVENGIPKLPILCWEQKITPLVEAAENELKKKNPNARIHKGAPLFNVGVCHFASGDLESGFKYLASAGREDELSGRGSPFPVLIGDHSLSKRFLIDPIIVKLAPLWLSDYQAITQSALDEAELVLLIKRAASRPTDGIQLVVALHRIMKASQPPQNDWTSFLRTRALADALVALESMLRRIHQTKGIESELHNQLTALLQVNAGASKEFNDFHQWFITNWKKKNLEKSAAAVNACVVEALTRFVAASTPSAKAGIACYAAVRLRNSLLHVLENSLDVYTDELKCLTMMGYILAVFRIAKHGEDGTLAGLP